MDIGFNRDSGYSIGKDRDRTESRNRKRRELREKAGSATTVRGEERDMTYDVIRGLLIILVMVGHSTRVNPLHQVIIYWFHMPAFFILSGMFFKDRGEPIHKVLIRLIKKYWFPMWIYFFIDVLTRRDIKMDYIDSNIWGGRIATGTVYWFPTCLIVSLFIYTVLKRTLRPLPLAMTVTALFIGSHFLNTAWFEARFERPVPWSADIALFALFFIFIGDRFGSDIRRIIKERNLPVFIGVAAVCIAILFIQYRFGSGRLLYSLNMKNDEFNLWIKDMIFPVFFTLLTFIAGYLVSRIDGVDAIMSLIGRHSMGIMYLHVVLLFYTNFLPIPVQFALVIVISILVDMLVNRTICSFREA